MLILLTIILIGLAPVVTWLANQYRLQLCIQNQVKFINDINDVVKEVLQTGNPKVEKLKVDGVCTECMWYNTTTKQMEIKFRYAATPYPVNVSLAWNGVSTEYGCENSNIESGYTYTLEINPNEVKLTGST